MSNQYMIEPIGRRFNSPLVLEPSFVNEINAPSKPLIQSCQSTIAPCSAIASAISLRPQLAAPESCEPMIASSYYMPDLIQLILRMEQIVQQEGRVCDADTQNSLNSLLAIDKARFEAMQKLSNDLTSRQTWSDWQNVAQYVACISSIIVGANICGISPGAGLLIIAGGIAGLTNRAVSDSGGWEWLAKRFTASVDLQHKIAHGIEITLSSVALLTAFSGTLAAWHTGILAINEGRDALMNYALPTVLVIGGALQSFIQLGIAYKDRNIAYFNAEIKTHEVSATTTRQEIRSKSQEFRDLINLSEKIDELVRDAISSMPT